MKRGEFLLLDGSKEDFLWVLKGLDLRGVLEANHAVSVTCHFSFISKTDSC